MIVISGLCIALAAAAVVLGAFAGAAWVYASLVATLVAAATLTLGAGRLARRRRAG